MACIEARGLRKVFGATVALDGIDLRVEEGRILGLIGPNGAGKTTALNAILGLTPYQGELKVLGRDPWIDRFVEVHFKTWYRNGGEPRIGRRLRALFNAAGVRDLRITPAVWCYATPAETMEWGESYAQRLLTSPMGERAVEYGYASRSDLEAMAAAFRAWSVHPDAFWSFLHVEALARKVA